MLMERFHPWQLVSSLKYPCRILDSYTHKHHRLLDRIIAGLTGHPLIFGKGFFQDGWGDISIVNDFQKYLEDKSKVHDTVALDHTLFEWSTPRNLTSHAVSRSASFPTPAIDLNLHPFLPPESHKCHIELVLPRSWKSSAEQPIPYAIDPINQPLVVLLPGTGEQGCVHRRTSLAIPLAEKGIASMILEGPFYGARKPGRQRGTKLRRVSDLPLLGRTTLEETRSLMSLLYSTFGYRRLAVAGRSMGGLHAAMISGLLRFPVGMVAWMSPPSAVPAFISGILSASCAWESLSSDEKYAAVRDMVDERSTQTDPKAMLRDILSITDIRNFPVPIKPEAGIVAVAKHDEYLGQIINEWQSLLQDWNGMSIRAYPVGHISGILFESQHQLAAIEEVLNHV